MNQQFLNKILLTVVLILIVSIVSVLFFGYQTILKNQDYQEPVVEYNAPGLDPTETYGVKDTRDLILRDGELGTILISLVDPESNQLKQYEQMVNTTNSVTDLTPVTDQVTDQYFNPLWNRPYLKVSETNNQIAQARPLTLASVLNTEPTPVRDWFIDLLNTEDGQIRETLSGATNPQWSSDGTKLYYLTPEGITRRDMTTLSTTTILSSEDLPESGLTTDTMFSLSREAGGLILTTRSPGRIVVFKLEDQGKDPTSLARIFNDNVSYSSPVLSPSAEFYAVVAHDIDATDGNLINPRIEVRPILGDEPLVTFSLTGVTPGFVSIDGWGG